MESQIVYAIERLVDSMLAMKVVFGGKSLEVVEYFKASIFDYVQFQFTECCRSHNAEIIPMDQSKCTLDEFPRKVRKDKAQYYLFRYRHTHENELLSSIGKNLVLYIFKITPIYISSNGIYHRYVFLFSQSLF